MENIFGMVTIPSIIVICYLIGQCVKTTALDNKHIPTICGICGGILGVVAMFVVPDYPANDVLTATAIGIVSGFAATGINQIFKQYSNKNNNEQ